MHVFIRLRYLLVHIGKGSDHDLLDKHSLCDAPSNSYPSLQVWFTTDPNVKESPKVFPLAGTPGSPQSLTKMRIVYK